MTDSNATLLPCPFCGSENAFVLAPDEKFSVWHVRCIDCDGGIIEETREQVIEAWNTRATLGAGECEESMLYFNLDDEESDKRVIVRVSELVRCLKHFREAILSNGGDYEHDMREIGGHLLAVDSEQTCEKAVKR